MPTGFNMRFILTALLLFTFTANAAEFSTRSDLRANGVAGDTSGIWIKTDTGRVIRQPLAVASKASVDALQAQVDSLPTSDSVRTDAEINALINANGFLTTEVDGDATNEIQTLSIDGSTLSLTNGGSVTIPTSGASTGLIQGRGANLTIVNGSITPTHTFHFVETENLDALDQITTIDPANAVTGDLLSLRTVSTVRDVVVERDTVNLRILADVLLDTNRDVLTLIKDGSALVWAGYSESNNDGPATSSTSSTAKTATSGATTQGYGVLTVAIVGTETVITLPEAFVSGRTKVFEGDAALRIIDYTQDLANNTLTLPFVTNAIITVDYETN